MKAKLHGVSCCCRHTYTCRPSFSTTRQASNDDDASFGWAAKLYDDVPIPTSSKQIPEATVDSILANKERMEEKMAKTGLTWIAVRRGANVRPTAAFVAAACRDRASAGGLAGGAFPVYKKPVSQRPTPSLIGRTRHGSTIQTRTNPKRRCVGRSPFLQSDDDKAAAAAVPEIGVRSTASPAPAMAIDPSARRVEGAARSAAPPTEKSKVKRDKETRKSAGGVGGGGANRGTKEDEGRKKAASSSPSTIPEYDIYSYSNKSPQAERKRAALLELARADMDLVNLERDFHTKNARFDDARRAHDTLHTRWVVSTQTLQAACAASNSYFEADSRAHQAHVVACRERQAAEARVREATKKSALAQTTLHTAEEAFHAAKQKAETYVTANAGTVAVKEPGACEVGSGRCDDDDAAPSSQGTPESSRKRSHSDVVQEPFQPSFAAMAPTKAFDGEGGSPEDRYRPAAKSRSTAGIHALSEEDERHAHAEGLQAQHKIMERIALQAADAAAKAPPAFPFEVEGRRADEMPKKNSNSMPALQAGLEAVTSGLADAGRNMKDAIESAKRVSADLDSAKAALDLSAAVVDSAVAARRSAVNNASLYVPWVNIEVAKQRNLTTWTKELRGAASRAWEAREKARKALNKAGARRSTAARYLKSFSRGDEVDTSRHALFKAVVEDERRRRC